MKRVVKISIEVKDDKAIYNLTKEDVIKLQNIFKGDITEINCDIPTFEDKE